MTDVSCLTLALNNVSSGNICSVDKIDMATRSKETNPQVLTWKLKWFCEETLLKFVAVLRAIRLGLATSALPVKRIS